MNKKTVEKKNVDESGGNRGRRTADSRVARMTQKFVEKDAACGLNTGPAPSPPPQLLH